MLWFKFNSALNNKAREMLRIRRVVIGQGYCVVVRVNLLLFFEESVLWLGCLFFSSLINPVVFPCSNVNSPCS